MKESADNYQLYKKKEEEARITDELDQNKITNVSVAEAPIQPQLPVKPNRPLNLILGVFLGALLSVGSVVMAEFMRDTVLTPRELEMLDGTTSAGFVAAHAASRSAAVCSRSKTPRAQRNESRRQLRPAQPRLVSTKDCSRSQSSNGPPGEHNTLKLNERQEQQKPAFISS